MLPDIGPSIYAILVHINILLCYWDLTGIWPGLVLRCLGPGFTVLALGPG